jgi:hypothetical protein
MKKTLLISDILYYNIDSLLYKKNNITHISITDIRGVNISEYSNILVILNEIMFDNIAKTGDQFDTQFHNDNELLKNQPHLFAENFNKFIKRFPKNTKFIHYGNNSEAEQKSARDYSFEWLEMNPNNYFITSREPSFTHKNMISRLIYLPMIYHFYIDNFYKYPMLDTPIPKNPKYDFITYLGQLHKSDKIQRRLDFLNKIFNDDISKIKYSSDSFSNERWFSKESYFWNMINSLSAKIQIIFETVNPWEKWYNDDWLTEKAMKCFLLSHPYILLLHPKPLSMLENYGFKFPFKCDSIEEYTKQIDYVKNNIDNWIDENKDIFYHNQTNFYNMVNSDELPHQIFIQKILENN